MGGDKGVNTTRACADAGRAADDGVRLHAGYRGRPAACPGRLRAWPHPHARTGSRHLRSRRCKRPLASIPPSRSTTTRSASCSSSSAVPTWPSREFRKAVEIDPKSADAHFHLGTAYAEIGRWEDAVTAYRRALALPTLGVPDFVHQNMGLALYHLRRYPEAESSLRFALSLDPQMQAAYYNLGLVLVAENRSEEAKAAFRQVRKLDPNTPFGQAALERLKSLGEGG